jgi:hypothetical protein
MNNLAPSRSEYYYAFGWSFPRGIPDPFRALALALLSIGMIASTAQADVFLNGSTCLDASCSSPDVIGVPPLSSSVGPVAFSDLYTAADGDQYSIAGHYDASYASRIPVFSFILSAVYAGNSTGMGPSVAADTFSVNVLEDFYDPSCCTWSGTFTESIPVVITNGVGTSTSSAVQFLWDDESVGLVTFTGPGNYYQFVSTDLGSYPPCDVFCDPYLQGDAQAVFSFGAGTQYGAAIDVLGTRPAPEPVEVIPVAGLVLGLVWMRMRQRKNVDG